LPKKKTRPWSRPLVTMLFLLQPIVRGWARYRGRLVAPSRPSAEATRDNLDTMALRVSHGSLSEVQYWAEQPLNRLAFIADMLNRLDQRGWPNKADIGWSDYDVEIYDPRWSKLQLATVAEEHPQGKQLLRCRLRTRWSLGAKVVFWGLASIELLVLVALRTHSWAPWLMLLSLPLFAWFLHREQRRMRSRIAVFLDEVAREWKLIKVHLAAQPKQAKKRGPLSASQTSNPKEAC
jgi:O-antigen biosynthesis protein